MVNRRSTALLLALLFVSTQGRGQSLPLPNVDGLDPGLCPNTGTPVPGGLTWHDAMLWIRELANSGRHVIGIDLVEVAPGATEEGADSWDAIVGARLLYRLIGTALATR